MSAPSDGTSMDAQLSVQDRLGPRKLINRTEYVRLLEQALHRLGYPDVANLLEQQAGVQMQPPAAGRFQAAVLGGRWEEAAALLPGLTPAAEVVREARFLILQQKYLEALEAQDLTTALTVLRCEMAALAAGGGGGVAAGGSGGGGCENGAAGGGAANGVAAAGEPGAAAGGGGGEGPAAAGAAAAMNGVAAAAASAGQQQQQQQQQALGAVGQAVVHEQQLHHLAALLLCPASGDAAARAAWLGGGRAHRPHLLSLLQARLPPHLMIPEGRLEVLVEQALEAQIQRCPYHNAPEGRLSLLADFQAGVECLPTTTVQVLEQHSDEVWHIAFSHDGSMLATASKDRTAVLWAVRPSPLPTTTTPSGAFSPSPALASASASAPASTSPQAATGLPNNQPNQPNQLNNHQQQQYLTPLHVLGGHSQPVAFLSWSPDDRRIITCSEEMLRVWDVATGQMLHCFSHHRESVTCCAWLPDCRRLVSGGADRAVCLVDGVAGRELQRWKRPYRVQDLAVTRDGAVLVMASSDRRVHLMRLADTREAALPPEPAPITSLALSPDGRLLLVALQTCTVRLWALGGAAGPHSPALDLGPDPLAQLPAAPAAEYSFNEGRPSRFVLRCGFGGSGGAFVVHGSDEGLVYVWHRDGGGGGGEPLLRLAGHTATVNAVAWNPANPYMLASASDDKTVRVWLAAAAQQGGGGPAAAAARKALPLLQFAPTANGGGGGGAVGMDVTVGGGAAAMAAEG